MIICRITMADSRMETWDTVGTCIRVLHQGSIPVAVILSIITCGIYGIYWMIKMNDEINQLAGGASGNFRRYGLFIVPYYL